MDILHWFPSSPPQITPRATQGILHIAHDLGWGISWKLWLLEGSPPFLPLTLWVPQGSPPSPTLKMPGEISILGENKQILSMLSFKVP